MRQVFNFQSTSDKLKFTFLTLLGLYLFAGYSLIAGQDPTGAEFRHQTWIQDASPMAESCGITTQNTSMEGSGQGHDMPAAPGAQTWVVGNNGGSLSLEVRASLPVSRARSSASRAVVMVEASNPSALRLSLDWGSMWVIGVWLSGG